MINNSYNARAYLPYKTIQQKVQACILSTPNPSTLTTLHLVPNIIIIDTDRVYGYESYLKERRPWCETISNKLKFLPEAQRNKFKLHIAIGDTVEIHERVSQNLARGYEIADQILRRNQVLCYKVVLPGITLEQEDPLQARKQMTVYTGLESDMRSFEAWEEIMDEIALTFVDNKIAPKPTLLGEQDVSIKGSVYMTYRSESVGHGIGMPYKEQNEVDPLQQVCLSDIFYAALLDKINNEVLLTKDMVTSLVKVSVKRDGMTSVHIARVIAHLKVITTQSILNNVSLAIGVLRAEQEIIEHNVRKINLYEVQTSYSESAANFNRNLLMKKPQEKLKKDEYSVSETPVSQISQLSQFSQFSQLSQSTQDIVGVAWSIAQTWKSIDEQWWRQQHLRSISTSEFAIDEIDGNLEYSSGK